MERLRVLIADKDVTYRKLIREAVERTGLGKVECIASNGFIAVEWLQQSGIDVVLLEINVLRTDGMDILRTIKSKYSEVEVIIVSTREADDAVATVEALKIGAIDFVLKPLYNDITKSVDSIRSYLHMLFAQIKIKKYSSTVSLKSEEGISETAFVKKGDNWLFSESYFLTEQMNTGVDLVVVASSTGGPRALETVLSGLPSDLDVPMLVVQHMPADFTTLLSQSLDKKCGLRVYEPVDSEPIKEGCIAIAPGGKHMVIDLSKGARKVLKLRETPFVNGVRPSADVLFNSVARFFKGGKVLVVILTGMGSDGTKGVEEMKKNCNCYCITQSEETCVVYGMPRSVLEAGLADEVADIKRIPERILQIVSNRG